MIDGGMAGLRALRSRECDKNGKISYTELVPVIGQEPDYDGALKVLQG